MNSVFTVSALSKSTRERQDMDNVIMNPADDIIGYRGDLEMYFKNEAREALARDNWGELDSLVEVLEMLCGYTNSDGLLVVSENNGMGFTVKKYKECYEEF